MRDGALQQIKSSANLRLISNNSIAEKILNLDGWSKYVIQTNQRILTTLNNFRIAAGRVFNGYQITENFPTFLVEDYQNAMKGNDMRRNQLKYNVSTIGDSSQLFTSNKTEVSDLLVQSYNL